MRACVPVCLCVCVFARGPIYLSAFGVLRVCRILLVIAEQGTIAYI